MSTFPLKITYFLVREHDNQVYVFFLSENVGVLEIEPPCCAVRYISFLFVVFLLLLLLCKNILVTVLCSEDCHFKVRLV